MADRFVISTSADQVTAYSKSVLTQYLQLRNWNVWHWQEDTWLIVRESSGLTPKQLNAELGKAIPELKNNLMILKIEGRSSYGGFQIKDSWDWMRDFWGRPDGS
jgi:hypothetical protein